MHKNQIEKGILHVQKVYINFFKKSYFLERKLRNKN